MTEESFSSDFFLSSTRHYFNLMYDTITPEIIQDDEKFASSLKCIFLQRMPILKDILYRNLKEESQDLLQPLFKAKSEKTVTMFKEYIEGDSLMKDDKPRAKVNLQKIKILNTFQSLIIEHERTVKNKKKRNEAKDKIFNDLNGLRFMSNIISKENRNIFNEFFKNFVSMLPENFLLLDFKIKKVLTEDLELEEDFINFFMNKCRENREIDEKKNERKRLFSEVDKASRLNAQVIQASQETQLELSNGTSLTLIANGTNKRKKTVDDYFPKTNKDIGFRGVKDIINNSGKNILTTGVGITGIISSSQPSNHSQAIQSIQSIQGIKSTSSLDNLSNLINPNSLLVDSINNLKDLPSCFSGTSGINSDVQSCIMEDNASVTEQVDVNSNTLTSVISGFQKMKSLSTSSNLTNSYNKSTNFSNVSTMLSNAKTSQFEYFGQSTKFNTNSSNIQSNSNSNLLVYNSQSVNSVNSVNSLNASNLSQSGENSNFANNRSLSMPRGINSRLAGSSIQMYVHAKKQRNPSIRKRGNLRLVDQMLEKINKVTESKRKTSADPIRYQENNLNSSNNLNSLNQSYRNNSLNNADNKSVTSSTNESQLIENPLKKLVNKKFYAKEKDLKTPSPLKAMFTKYSKKRPEDLNPNQEQDKNNMTFSSTNDLNTTNISSNSNSNNTINQTNSNLNKFVTPSTSNLHKTANSNKFSSSLNARFLVLKEKDITKSNSTMNKNKSYLSNSNMTFKKDSNSKNGDIKEIFAFNSLKCDESKSNDKIITLTKMKQNNILENINKKINESSADSNNVTFSNTNKKSATKSDMSEDEVLVYSTPTKVGENFKFGKRSPNASSRINLMNLFKQIKSEK